MNCQVEKQMALRMNVFDWKVSVRKVPLGKVSHSKVPYRILYYERIALENLL